ncbi:hypothetical protein D515_04829 [Grimontia indica]|uniref:Uncharacterized protein n=1 Tax=Grimontia indica TaxID=1056512 RepID=R1IZN9_9GAMM|nr:hypothetical protein D515_04829 [Grimontia indica]
MEFKAMKGKKALPASKNNMAKFRGISCENVIFVVLLVSR